MPQIEIIGVYPVEAEEPVHLIELRVSGARGLFNLGEVTQELPRQPRSNWQVPHMEHILNGSGEDVLADDFEAQERADLWKGDPRLVFFFHYLDFEQPLKTPFGDLQLPAESELPARLAMIQYEQP